MSDTKYSNHYISNLLKWVAASYEVLGEDKFRIRAYQNAASSIEHATSEIKDMWDEGKLKEIPGVGASIAGHLDEYFKTGKVTYFEKVLSQMPPGMFGLFGIQGIGAKTAFKLAQDLKIKENDNPLAIVKKAAEEGKIRALEGFGEKKESELLEAIDKLKPNKETRPRILLSDATEIAQRYTKHMLKCKEVKRIEPLGSLRRRLSTIGDIDFAVVTSNAEVVLNHFTSFSEVAEVLNQGDIKASVLLVNGVRVDLMTEEEKAFGSLLQHFTGSKMHNVALRKVALSKGMSLSEHGIKENGKLLEFPDEESFYNHIGLKFIPPEIREDTGELELFEKGKKTYPNFILQSDIKGDLHSHTDFSDGQNTLEQMIKEAKTLGYSYLGISDHAPSVKTRGLDEVLRIVKDTKKIIEQQNSSDDSIRVLYGYEVNILADETISLPDEVLKHLDYAIGSIHTSFDQDKKTITRRLVNAINNPYINFIAHPSGRLLNQRDAYEVDWEEVFKACLEKNKIIEINSHPERLDLPDVLVREAIKKGVRLIINTDAHSIEDFSLMRYGIDIARRGWAEPKNVVNTLPLKDFLKEFLLH